MKGKVLTQSVVKEISTRMDYYAKDVRNVLDCFAGLISEHVDKGESVHYAKLGTFSQQSALIGTKQTKTVKFQPAK